MPKFRKRPLVIEAEQYNGQGVDGVCTSATCHYAKSLKLAGGISHPHIHTLEGPLEVSLGDYVITGVKGEKYPCKPDIFELTYEKVERM